jgi:hypothetical protein
MSEYRVPEFTLKERMDAALRMLVPFPEREWGLVTMLAHRHSVSRTTLYEIRDRLDITAFAGDLQEKIPRVAGAPGLAGATTDPSAQGLGG